MCGQLEKFQEKYDFLVDITRSEPFRQANITDLSKLITKKVAEMLEVEMVCIWWLGPEKDHLTLGCGYSLSQDQFSEGDIFDLAPSPILKQAICLGEKLNFPDVANDPATQAYYENFFKPQGITSLCGFPIEQEGKIIGTICIKRVGNNENLSHNDESFIQTLTSVFSNVIALKRAVTAENNYKIAINKLRESNLTLKNVLSRIDDEKKSIHETVAYNLEVSVKPIITELKIGLNKHQLSLVKHLEAQLNSLSNEFLRNLVNFNSSLTPTEIKVVEMVKNGLRAKEIAGSLGTSISTVETHKKNIRKKLNITNKSVNLKSYLDMMSDDS